MRGAKNEISLINPSEWQSFSFFWEGGGRSGGGVELKHILNTCLPRGEVSFTELQCVTTSSLTSHERSIELKQRLKNFDCECEEETRKQHI